MKNINIISGSGIIDFHINKKTYESYKKELYKKRYVEKILLEKLELLKEIKISDNFDVKDFSITLNNFWDNTDFCFINDIGFSVYNEVPLNENVLTVRIFHIDFLALTELTKIDSEMFFNIKTDDIYFSVSNLKLV